MINRAILYSKFIRYDELANMMRQVPSTMELGKGGIEICNIYIDIQSIYKDVLTNEILPEDNKTIAINILNMAAHYRHFFRNALKKNVCVYLVNSRSTIDGNIAVMQNHVNEISIYNLVEVLCKYIPGLYYIHRTRINACAIIYSLIKDNTLNDSHLIISNDVYANQLPTLFNNTIVLRVGSKHKYFVTVNTAIYGCFKNTTTTDLPPTLIPIIMAFNKCADLGITLMYPYKTALKKVKELTDSNTIYLGYNTMTPNVDDKKGFFKGFYSRWKVCDLVQVAQEYINSPDILDTTWQVKRQCDFRELASIIDEKINSFPDNVINYIFLLE